MMANLFAMRSFKTVRPHWPECWFHCVPVYVKYTKYDLYVRRVKGQWGDNVSVSCRELKWPGQPWQLGSSTAQTVRVCNMQGGRVISNTHIPKLHRSWQIFSLQSGSDAFSPPDHTVCDAIKAHLVATSNMQSWQNDYLRGTALEMYTETLSSSFQGMPFAEASE